MNTMNTTISSMPMTSRIAVYHLIAPDASEETSVADERRDTGDDTGEQDHRDAVADAELIDLLAHPHQEGRAGHEGHDDDKACRGSRSQSSRL